MAQEAARRLVREIALPESSIQGLRAERTMHVEGIPKDCASCEAGGCFYVATYVIRVALENQASKIVVKRGPNHRHEFDVIHVLNAIKRLHGGRLARPRVRRAKGIHPYLATAGHRAVGNWTDRTRLVVPVALSLSGLNPGRKA